MALPTKSLGKSKDDALEALVRGSEDRGEAWETLETSPVLSRLVGPHLQRDRFPTKVDAVLALQRMTLDGKNIIFIEELAVGLTGDSATNLVVPAMVHFDKKTYVEDVIVVADPKDAERVARMHVKKSTFYGDNSNFLGDGVLTTRNNEAWHEQRTNLAEAFLPLASLAKIMPVSVLRADFAIGTKLKSTQNTPVDMWEFFLFEAMAQLHLALLGESAEFSDKNNVLLRTSFTDILRGPLVMGTREWKAARAFVRGFSHQVLSHTKNSLGELVVSAPFRAQALGCPVLGPVGAKLAENTPTHAADPVAVQRDTATTISFAGFDTTANLMTWVTFEMCRRPELQRRLQEEIDGVYDGLIGRALVYEDLSKFAFLTRVINETLRLWTSVPNGSFRELACNEFIEASFPGRAGGEASQVRIPAGSQVWIPSWLLHRSEALWGKDVLEFNPDRAWLPEESWFGKNFGGTNPSSHRFCPFTYPPRGCLGLNFAQMEARVILSRAFREFDFAFAEPTKSRAALGHTREHFLGANRGTMGPEGGMFAVATPRQQRRAKV